MYLLDCTYEEQHVFQKQLQGAGYAGICYCSFHADLDHFHSRGAIVYIQGKQYKSLTSGWIGVSINIRRKRHEKQQKWSDDG